MLLKNNKSVYGAGVITDRQVWKVSFWRHLTEDVLQSRYYVHFRANTLGKGMKPFILPAMG